MELLIKLLTAALIINGSMGASEIPPKIVDLASFWEFWKDVSSSMVKTNDKYGFVLHPLNSTNLSTQADLLFLECESNYPIQWRIPPEITEIDAYINRVGRESESGPFISSIRIKVRTSGRMSARIQCERITNSTMQSGVYLFKIVKNAPTIWTKTDAVFGSRVIPCVTSDPTLPVQLYNKTHLVFEVTQNDALVSYSPTIGFIASQNFIGNFSCRQANYSVDIHAYDEKAPDYGVKNGSETREEIIYISPQQQTATLNCSLPRYTGIFKLRERSPIRLSQSWTGKIGIANIQVNISEWSTYAPYFPTQIDCILLQAERNQIFFTWTVKVGGSGISVDDYSQKIGCFTVRQLERGWNVTLKILFCEHSLDCQYLLSVRDRIWNNNIDWWERPLVTKTLFPHGGTYCLNYIPSQHRYRLEHCATLAYSFFSGVVRCESEVPARHWIFFTSLDFLKYTDWREATPRELIRMDEVEHVQLTGKNTSFVCEAVHFLFSSTLELKIEYQNGSKKAISNDDANVRIIQSGNYIFSVRMHKRHVKGLNIFAFLTIVLPLEAVAIHCGALWTNSTDILWTKQTFEVREPGKPIITEPKLFNQDLFVGRTYQLQCSATGEPSPSVTWLYKGQVLTNAFPQIKSFPEVKSATHTTRFLEFPELPDEETAIKYTGEFECRANNSIGNESHKIHVKLGYLKASPSFLLPAIISPISVVTIGGLLVLVYVFYDKSKKRDMTKQEIEEFFEGRPDFVSEVSPDPSQAHFLPYNKDFELSEDDIEYDNTGNKLLGSGHFALVLRGKIVSKGLPAAIKLSKSNSDITFFKSLLSEVKIMVHIGNHENLVKLVGVCTAKIRNRTIQIATEICELGSLDKFLRKSSSTFINLLNANHQIDSSQLKFDGFYSKCCMSTIDLISFSSQIANGMEYLTRKNVIHGDLATRNVLLTKRKVAKISDFGLSKKLYHSAHYVKKSKSPLPWRWMAIESLTQLTFSSKSDVWAFGVTLYEIFTLGGSPFPNETWSEEFVERLTCGMRMGRPAYSTPEIYARMVACWESDPTSRPDFSCLFEYFSNLLEQHNYLVSNRCSDSSDPEGNSDDAKSPPDATEVGEYLELVDNCSE